MTVSRESFASWCDMDFNAHMRNTAFLDKVADTRMLFFAKHGFSMRDFMHLRIGPVVQKDEIEYFREIHLLQEFTITLAVAGASEDSSRFRLHSEFVLANQQLAAVVVSTGGWLDLNQRKLVAPPRSLVDVLELLPRTSDFEILTSSIKEAAV